jgi:hypothetical protein
MAEVTNELMHEVLRDLQQRAGRSEARLGEILQELVAIRLSQLSMQTDVHNIYGILGRHDERLDRIERRLELRELAEKPQTPFEPR